MHASYLIPSQIKISESGEKIWIESDEIHLMNLSKLQSNIIRKINSSHGGRELPRPIVE